MIRCDEDLVSNTGLTIGTCGDDTDNHAGANETSLMLAVQPEAVSDMPVSPSTPPALRGISRLIGAAGGFLGKLGFKSAADDMTHLSKTLAWISDLNIKPYMGNPLTSARESGQRMLQYHVSIGIKMLDAALKGERPHNRPMLWPFRILRLF
jgi:creatinine amidohydrolase/Fe(II)-dependent formamide hydrolase-like protein